MEAREETRVSVEVNPNKCYILIGDISVSMQERDPRCAGLSRYDYMLEKFKLFISQASEFDEHGEVDVILFGERVHVFKEVTLEKIGSKLNRIGYEGMTNLDKALESAYELHLEEKKEMKSEGKIHPGTVCFVFTDGAPTNKRAVEQVIVDIANHITKEDEFNITFLTVGSVPADLNYWLNGLHDSLESRLTQDFDIFHCEKLEDVDFLSAVNTVNHD